ncbi:hypothetical protein [Pseudomonas brassicacearum]|uniref:hypothetical protein n=1 Tax=Pseudomonas brassicacearum TaxID=930166 RepID=UPI001D23F636|nr:hypothetical protein [Pseudomonas brassicacearum]CAH0246186.1 hypothetical protein SRABI06_03021 [Pseudomonas brassicacearum]
MANFALPILTQFSGNKPAEKITINLSKLEANLEVQIPDSNEISADWSVYPILGANKDHPDWSGQQVAAGTWDDANDGMVKLTGLKVTVPKAELQKYLGRQVELRYRFANESGYDLYSDPSVKLKIEP